ncbi:MAG: biotin--[acetyl-CoA-carboxylase] ligase [Acidimicrobiales bacterium]
MPGDGARNLGDRARAALAGSRFAEVRWLASTGSTNADVLALARDGAAEGVVIVAEHQTAGRGRHERTWVAPPGGSLLLSVLLRPPFRVASATTMATAVALAEAVEEATGVSAGLKWPNDLVLAGEGGERKLAGILAEAEWPASATISAGWREPSAHERAVVVVGVGLNVSWPEDDEATRALADTAVALDWVTSEPIDRVDLLVAFLRRLDRSYGQLVRDGHQAAMDEWRRRSATLGRRVRVELGADDAEGTAVDVTPEGHLVVEALGGQRRTFAVGDVIHLRDA